MSWRGFVKRWENEWGGSRGSHPPLVAHPGGGERSERGERWAPPTTGCPSREKGGKKREGGEIGVTNWCLPIRREGGEGDGGRR
eukprot:365106-Chlamydomonas_euryale.AAC.1